MSADQIAGTALVLGILGFMSPRTGWALLLIIAIAYIGLGWVPFAK